MIKVKLVKNRFSQQSKIVDYSASYQEGESLFGYLHEMKVFEEIGPVPNPENIRIVSCFEGSIENCSAFIPKDGEEFVVSYDVGSFLIPVLTALWPIVIAVAVQVGIQLAIQAIIGKPKAPNFGTFGNGIDDGSPAYSWNGVQTTQDVGLPVPIVYGRHRVGGNVVNTFLSEDGDKSYLNVLLALCEGEINSVSGQEIKGQPIANFDGVSSEIRYGTNSQSVIKHFEDLHDVRTSDFTLTKNNAQVYTTVGTDIEAVELYFVFPSGLFQQDENGDVREWTVSIHIEYKLNSSGTWTDLGTINYTFKTRTTARRIYRIENLSAGKYDVRVTKTSDDSTLDPVKTGDVSLSQVDEIRTDDFTYPNTALIGFRALATDQLSGNMPNMTCLIEGKKVSVPDIRNAGNPVDWEDYYWDPDYDSGAGAYRLLSDDTVLTWDGSTYVNKWSANPIWCLRDLLTNTRYGLGDYVESSDIDLEVALEKSRICEEKVPNGSGGYEKRFTLNIVLDSFTEALEVITQICTVFAGVPFYNYGRVKFEIDRPQQPDTGVFVPDQIFGMGNIAKDSAVFNWKDINEIYNVVNVQFLNKNLNYARDVISYIDEESLANGDRINPLEVRLFVTSPSEAYRMARYILRHNKLVKRSVSFRAGIDSIACQVGSRILVSHDVTQWGYSGRIKSASSSQVVLDKEVEFLPGVSYQIMVRLVDDSLVTKTITNFPGITDTINISGTFSTVPAAYDGYIIGVVNNVSKPFTVSAIDMNERLEAEIVAFEYVEEVWDDSDFSLPTFKFSLLDLEIPLVQNLALTEIVVKQKDGTIENTIDVWFNRPSQMSSVYVRSYKKAFIYISPDGVNWGKPVGATEEEHFKIIGGLSAGNTYYVKVVSGSEDGSQGNIASAPSSSIQLQGKSAPPSDVTSFIVNQNRDRLFMGWTSISDGDLSGYEIRRGTTWGSGEFFTFEKSTRFLTTDVRIGQGQKFWIKAVDTSGNYSVNATEAEIDIDEVPFRNLVQETSEAPSWSGTKTNTEVDTNDLVLSSGQLTGTYETPEIDIGYVSVGGIFLDYIITNATGQRFDDDTTTRFNSSSSSRFSGEELPGAASFEIRTSEDDITWTAYRTYQVGDYKCRYYQIRVTITRESLGNTIRMTKFDHIFDLPDVDEFGEATISSNPSSGVSVTLDKTYHETPHIDPTILSGSAVFAQVLNLDLTGFDLKLFDSGGTAVTGRASYHAHGI